MLESLACTAVAQGKLAAAAMPGRIVAVLALRVGQLPLVHLDRVEAPDAVGVLGQHAVAARHEVAGHEACGRVGTGGELPGRQIEDRNLAGT